MNVERRADRSSSMDDRGRGVLRLRERLVAARAPAVCLAMAMMGAAAASPAFAHDAPGAHQQQDPIAALQVGRQMATAAKNLWAALSPDQQKQAGFEFDNEERLNWHFIPRPRKGLPWKEMNAAQRKLAHGLLAAGLSQQGYLKAQSIMSLEAVLADIEHGSGAVRDSDLYFFSVFGNPAADDPKAAWGWRVEGHHLSLNFTIAGNRGIAAFPAFMGANPAEVRQGPRKGLRVLGEEEDMGFALVRGLNEEQKKSATFSTDAPKEVITGNKRVVDPLNPAGLPASKLDEKQQKLLMELIENYAHRMRGELADKELSAIHQDFPAKVHFAWAGATEAGQGHYYRIQGPTFLIEFDNTQNDANHIHTVWRNFKGDFGADLLKAHYEQSHEPTNPEKAPLKPEPKP